MKVFKYVDYVQYVNSQIKAFKKKYENRWCIEENIKFIADFIKLSQPKNGLCHGVRQGFEQKWFMKYLEGCSVIGTEIGETPAKNTVQWDFNKENKDWIGKFDFIYSNSFDHAFNPKETLKVWARQLKSGGCIILEYDKRQEHTGEISRSVNKTDPVSITVEEMEKIALKWIKGCTVEIINLPVVKIGFQKAIIINVI